MFVIIGHMNIVNLKEHVPKRKELAKNVDKNHLPLSTAEF